MMNVQKLGWNFSGSLQQLFINIPNINTFKYHVSFTDGKISVRINLLFYLFFTVVPSNIGWDNGGKIGKIINSNRSF